MQQPLTSEELKKFRPGIYLHYKGHLYEVLCLTHNASQEARVEVLYVPLELDPGHEGPRHATREFREFLFDRVHDDGSKCEHDVHVDYPAQRYLCANEQRIVDRFHFLGPVFNGWMVSADPFRQ